MAINSELKSPQPKKPSGSDPLPDPTLPDSAAASPIDPAEAEAEAETTVLPESEEF